jgi:adenylate cyclase
VGVEIERKFLVKGDSWRAGATGTRYRQGYLSNDKQRNVRVRIGGGKAFLTVKGISRGASRDEFEYEVPIPDAEALLNLCLRPLIEKVRYRVEFGGMTWEIDEFEGDNRGLVLAEVELPSEDHPLALPPWADQEVTHDPRYFNSSLVSHPYTTWPAV